MVNIRLNKTDSIRSVNKENSLDVNLNVTSKVVKYNNIRETVDSYEVYKDERKKCNRYRLILTINPFCTNVLFNPLTEIAKYTSINGSLKIERILDSEKVNGVDGSNTSQRVQFIANTTYSNADNGYTYYPGYDIFDNHILRAKEFTVINSDKTNTGSSLMRFNTLCDYARNKSGEFINIFKRIGGISARPKQVRKHVYNYDTLMSYEESVNNNLSEQDGWLGFPNITKLKTYYSHSNKAGHEVPTNWNCVLNNYNAGEFVQMYPDRSAYSFVPYYNTFLNRLEYNWDILITYPYMNDYDHELIKCPFNGKSALKIFSAELRTGLTGEPIVMFRTPCKHNLVRNDYVYIMWDGKENNDEEYRVSNVGGLNGENTEYYFYVDDPVLVNIFDDPETIYMQKITNGIPSEYYFRRFKKLDYNGKLIAKEQYNLGFATTVYNDGVTQITFTDNLDFTDIIDNLGRPVCEFYITILKTNRGNKEWYSKADSTKVISGQTVKNVEVSHCFTKLTDGLYLFSERLESDEDMVKQKDFYNVRYIGGNNIDGETHDIWLSNGNEEELVGEWNWHGITKEQDWFYGDIVEFVPSDFKEYVIAKVNYRFNSYQRENPANFICEPQLVYHEIASDDYDFGADFAIKDIYGENATVAIQNPRNEGYFYNPHYPIRIKEEGDVEQGSHYTIRVRNAIVIQLDDVRIKIVSMQTSNVNNNDIVLLMDDKNGKIFEFKVIYIESSTTFYITPVNGWFGEDGFIEQTAAIYGSPLVWVDIAEQLRRGNDMFIRRYNYEIPSYAVLAGRNIFLWRKYYNNGELVNGQLPEYVFANNSFYLTPVINFYVKRQDPNGYFGLYRPENQNPQDIAGETKKPSNYSYNDTETKATC